MKALWCALAVVSSSNTALAEPTLQVSATGMTRVQTEDRHELGLPPLTQRYFGLGPSITYEFGTLEPFSLGVTGMLLVLSADFREIELEGALGPTLQATLFSSMAVRIRVGVTATLGGTSVFLTDTGGPFTVGGRATVSAEFALADAVTLSLQPEFSAALIAGQFLWWPGLSVGAAFR